MGQDDISPETLFKLHSLSLLMGHFQPTPQNSCQAGCAVMMLLSVTECVDVFVVMALSSRVTDISVLPQIFLYDCTEVSPFSLLFFGGDITIQKDEDQETIAVDQWIVFRSPARIAHLVKVNDTHIHINDTSVFLKFLLY